jgi:hypothetical protein
MFIGIDWDITGLAHGRMLYPGGENAAEFGDLVEEILIGLLQELDSESQVHMFLNGRYHLPNLDLIVRRCSECIKSA